MTSCKCINRHPTTTRRHKPKTFSRSGHNVQIFHSSWRLLLFAPHARSRRLLPLRSSPFRGRRLIRLSTLASSSARCPACDTHRPPLRLHTGRDTSCLVVFFLFYFIFCLFVCFSKSSEWEADGSRRKDPGLLSWCDVIVSDACVHVVSNGASARSVNILSGAAQGAFRDALSLQQHRKIYVSLFVITNGCQKCKENLTFFFFFVLRPLTGFCLI